MQRFQCRDLYDLYRLAEDAGVSMGDVTALFARKARAKNLDPEQFEGRFEDRLGRYKSRWDVEMGEHLANPPSFDDVARVMFRHLRHAGLIGT
jgi:predicted nucleotidyltransferase component of viral defense system